MKPITLTELKKYLKTADNIQLQNDILELFKNYSEVKEYYTVKIKPENEAEILKKYMDLIEKEFIPNSRGRVSMDYPKIREAIKHYESISKNPKNVAALMLWYAEVGVDFTNSFGDIDERFYNNIFKAYSNALEYIYKNDLQDVFSKKAEQLMEESQNIGWGFAINIEDLYYEYYSSDEEDD